MANERKQILMQFTADERQVVHALQNAIRQMEAMDAKAKQLNATLDASRNTTAQASAAFRRMEQSQKDAVDQTKIFSQSVGAADTRFLGAAQRLNSLDDATRKANQGFLATTQGLAGVVRGAASAVLGFSLLAGGAVALGAELGRAISEAARYTTQIEYAVASIRTIEDINVGQTTAQLADLAGTNNKVYSTSVQLAAGLKDVYGSIDADATQALDLLTVSAEAATGGLTKVQTASSALLPILNAFDIEVSRAREVSDALFVTVDEGRITFEQLATGLGRVTPAAKIAGISYQEMLAAIAAGSRILGDAETTLTYMQNLFSKWSTREAQEGFLELGIKVTDLEGNFRPLNEVLAEANARLAGLSEARRAAVLQEVFPDIQARGGFIALLDAEKAGKYNEILLQIKSNTDATARAAEIMGTTSEAVWNRLIERAKGYGATLLEGPLILLAAMLEQELREAEELTTNIKRTTEDAFGVTAKVAFQRMTDAARSVHDARMAMEEDLEALRGTGSLAFGDLGTSTATEQYRRFYQVSKKSLQELAYEAEKAAEALEKLDLTRQIDQAYQLQLAEYAVTQARERLNAVTERYNDLLDAARDKLDDLNDARDRELDALRETIEGLERQARVMREQHQTSLEQLAAGLRDVRNEELLTQQAGERFLEPFKQQVVSARGELERLRQQAAEVRQAFADQQSALDAWATDIERRMKNALVSVDGAIAALREQVRGLDDEIRGYQRTLDDLARAHELAMRPLQDAIYAQGLVVRGVQDEIEAANRVLEGYERQIREIGRAFDRELLPKQRELNELNRQAQALDRAADMRRRGTEMANLRAQAGAFRPGSAEAADAMARYRELQSRTAIDQRRYELQDEIALIEERKRAALEEAQARAEAQREYIDGLQARLRGEQDLLTSLQRQEEAAQRAYELERRGVEDALHDAQQRKQAIEDQIREREREREAIVASFDIERGLHAEATENLRIRQRIFESLQRQAEAAAEQSVKAAEAALGSAEAIVNANNEIARLAVVAYGQIVEAIGKRFTAEEKALGDLITKHRDNYTARETWWKGQIEYQNDIIKGIQEEAKTATEKAQDFVDAEQRKHDALRTTYAWINAVIQAQRGGVAPPPPPPGQPVEGRAYGGPVHAGRSYFVGERGPELLTMGASGGMVTPLPNLPSGGGGMGGAVAVGGATSFNIVVNAPNLTGSDPAQMMRLGEQIVGAADFYLKRSGRGGIATAGSR